MWLWIKKIVLIISVYAVWNILLSSFIYHYSDDEMFAAIPFTILTIYVWDNLRKK